MWSVFVKQLGARSTVRTALVVGTLINLYGQVLVPLFRGTSDVIDSFAQGFGDAPLLTILSVGLGFAFPWMVSAYSSTRARLETRGGTSTIAAPREPRR